jgi:hypothetical protein
MIKKLLLFSAFIAIAITAHSQWTTADGSGNINSTNSNNVGIGTTAPAEKLNVYKSGSASKILIGNPASNYTNLLLGTSQDANSGYSFLQSVSTSGASPTYGDLYLNTLGGNVVTGFAPASGLSTNIRFDVIEKFGTALRLRAGSSGGSQILFSYGGGTSYAHSIKTRHNGSSPYTGNAIDFYTWNNGSLLNLSLNNGNVGIGIADPLASLHISNTNPILAFSNTGYSTTNWLAKMENTGAFKIQQSANFSTVVDRIVIDGTTGKASFTGQDAEFFSAGATTNTLSTGRDTNQKFSFQTTDTHGYLDYIQDDDGTSGHTLNIRNQSTFGSSNDIVFQTGGITNALVLKGSGAVGIGTAPASGLAFHLQGNSTAISTVMRVQQGTNDQSYSSYELYNNITDGPGLSIRSYGSNYPVTQPYERKGGASIMTTLGEAGKGGLAIAAKHTNAVITFHTGASSTERMKIWPSGSVSIGTCASDPTLYKLVVEGKVGAREVQVTASGWPDYVFSPDYKLPSLSALDIFVRENKHLPEIPTAAEVEKNGIALGELNALLLKKVEELTLYLIDQQKQIDELKAAVKQNSDKK